MKFYAFYMYIPNTAFWTDRNKIKGYVARVKELGMNSAAITDHGVMLLLSIFIKKPARRASSRSSAVRFT